MKHRPTLNPVLILSTLAVLGAPLLGAADEKPAEPAPAAPEMMREATPAPETAPAAPAAPAPEAPAPEAPAQDAPALPPPVRPEPPNVPNPPLIIEPDVSSLTATIQNPPPVSVGDVQIFGENFDTDQATGLTTITGNPRIVRGQDEIRATRLVVNPRTLQVTAEGDVIIRQGGQEIRAFRATYSLSERSGQADGIRTQFSQYYIAAEQILLKPGPSYEARRARFSTCDREKKHYEVYSRVVDIIPNERITAQSSGVDLLGVRLFTVPKVQQVSSQGDGDLRSNQFPTVGFDSYNGPYARKEFQLRRSGPAWVDFDVQLNAFNEPQGGLRAASTGTGPFQFVGSLYYRDVAPNQRARHLQVSRLPEVGVIWGRGNEPRPGRFLANQVSGVRYPEDLNISTDWRVMAQLSLGIFRQHRGDNVPEADALSKNGGRITAQVQAVKPLVNLGFFKLNDLRFMVRQNFYDTGDRFTVFGTGIGKKWDLGSFRFRIDRFDQFTTGSTPFLFDDIELRQEWRPELKYRSKTFSFSYAARIRGRTGELFDQVFSVSKLFHCLEPRLTYSVRRQQFFVEIRIPGLFGSTNSPAGQPATEDSATPQPGSIDLQ